MPSYIHTGEFDRSESSQSDCETSFPDHELRVGEIARDMGFTNISLSHQIIAMQKYVPRAHTGSIRRSLFFMEEILVYF